MAGYLACVAWYSFVFTFHGRLIRRPSLHPGGAAVYLAARPTGYGSAQV